MWQWYHLRAQELARERIAEADAWRLAHSVAQRAAPRTSRPGLLRLRRAPEGGR
jgi:hypothetical protein